MAKKRLPKFFYSESWKMNYYYCIGWSAKAFESYMKKEWNYEVQDMQRCAGKCVYLQDADGFAFMAIWTRPKSCDSILVHECTHAALWTVQRAHWEMDYDNSEPFTYLLESIYRKAIGK